MNVLKRIAVVCSVAISAATVWGQSVNDIKSLNAEGLRLYEAARFAEADSVFQLAIATQERDAAKMNGEDYLTSLVGLANIYYAQVKYAQASDVYTKMALAVKKEYGDSSAEYAKVLNGIGALKVATQQFSSVKDILDTALTILEKTGKSSEEHAKALINLGDYYTYQGEYEAAELHYLKALRIVIKELGGEENIRYAHILTTLGTLKFTVQDFRASEDYYKKSLAILRNHKDDQFGLQAQAVSYLSSNVYLSTGRYQEAKKQLQEVLAVIKNNGSQNHVYYVPILLNMGTTLMSLGEYDEAELVLIEASGAAKSIYGEKHDHYISSLNSLFLLYQDKGEYDKAEPLVTKCLALRKELHGATHQSIGVGLMNLGALYGEIGNYPQAEKAILEANEITLSTIGENSTQYAGGLNLLASLYIVQEEYDKAYPILMKAESIQSQTVGVEKSLYLSIFRNLFTVSMHNRNLFYEEELKQMAIILVQVNKELFGENHHSYFYALLDLARIYISTKDLGKAREIYDSLLVSVERALGKEHPCYSKIVFTSAINYELANNIEQAKFSYSTYLNLSKDLVIRSFSFMSEKEREMYWKTLNESIKYILRFADLYEEKDPTIVCLAYDCVLFSNSLLLHSSQAVRQSILESNNKQLMADWNRLMELKNNPLSDQATIMSLEKQLMIDTKEHQGRQANYLMTWKDVAHSLAKDEVAIEFVTYEIENSAGIDENRYTALILRRFDSKVAITMQPLCGEDSLMQALKSSDSKYEKLYHLVWKPMNEYLEGVKRIYVSPTGLLNTVPFAAIHNKGEYLSEQYDIHNVLSSKDIRTLKKGLNQSFEKRAVLFGGADFGLPITELNKATDTGSSHIVLRSLLDEYQGKRGQGFDYLPGTMQEVEQIDDILSKQDWGVTTFVDKDATETRLKSSTGKDSPALLHISTHGYYFPLAKGTASNTDIPEAFGSDKYYKRSENPLMRCGLLFSGANSTWKGQKPPQDTDDGILTAYEIANLDLSNTELVVLSACDTGLGDVDYSEGVYGLQRAFRLAGVKSMIVSLWKVSDKDTLEFMVEFYKQWALSKDKKEAFDKAQSNMKKKYSDDISKWASFILIE